MKTYLIKLIGYKSNLRVVVGGRIIILTLVYNSSNVIKLHCIDYSQHLSVFSDNYLKLQILS